MKTPLISIWFFILLSGCQIEEHRRQQALGGIELVGKLGNALEEFKQQEAAAENSILKSAKRASKISVQLGSSLKNDGMGRTSASADRQIQTISKLKAFTEGIAKNDTETTQQLAQLDAEYSTLLAPIPSTLASTLETQKSFSELAKPLSLKVQFNETKKIIDDVEKNYKDVVKPKLEANKSPSSTNP